MPIGSPAPPSSTVDTSTVVELRRYTLHPGKRDVLVNLFEREFIESQEATGARVLGQFRDADRADHFVWLRGFRDMPSRAASLGAFYGGPVWKAHRDAANATMIDSDDVLLLRPAGTRSGFALPAERPAFGEEAPAAGLLVATIYRLALAVDEEFDRYFEAHVAPALEEAGAAPIARFRTEYAKNDFPSLPVRTGVNAYVWFASFVGEGEHAASLARLARSRWWTEVVEPDLGRRLAAPPERSRLLPTARSLIRHAAAGTTRLSTGGAHDFDFLAGQWSVANRRLRAREAGATSWDEFPAVSRASPYLGGVANVDEIVFPTQGRSGLTLRTFEATRRQWSIYWLDGKSGALFPPVRGGFAGDRGEFYGEDVDGGRPVRVRFIWLKRGVDRARWEQAFSRDGTTWETNWTMDLTRIHG